MRQICKKCNIEKDFDTINFPCVKVKGKIYLEKSCKACKIKRGLELRHKRYHKDPEFRKKVLSHNDKSRIANQIVKNDTWKRRVEKSKEWKAKNRDKVRQRDKDRHYKRYADPTYRVSKQMSNKINLLIKDKNNTSWVKCVEYSINDLMTHLEAKFRDGMTWDNYGSHWHIDHIKPVSWFKFTSKNDAEFKQCWALSNLQPLLVKENLTKGNRFMR